MVCKTIARRFESDPRLQLFLQLVHNSPPFRSMPDMSGAAWYPMKALWFAALCVLFAMRTPGQTTTTTDQGGTDTVIPTAPSKLPNSLESRQNFRSDGAQFTYPVSYTLYTGAGQVPTYTCQSAVACVVYPRDRYAGTNFLAASFEERVIDGAKTKRSCLTPQTNASVPEFTVAREPKIINGVQFLHGTSTDAAASLYMSTDLYRTFHLGRCYELSINLATNSFGSFDPGTVREFTSSDDQRVRAELTTILDSFRFVPSGR